MFNYNYPHGDLHDLNLDWMLKTIKDLANMVDNLEQEVSGYLNEANRYTDEQNRLVLEKVDAKLRQLEFDLNQNYSDFVAKINGNIQVLNQNFEQLKRETGAAIQGANAYTDTRIDQNNDFIFEKIGSEILDVKVLNYFTGEYVPIQEMFDYLAAFHLNNAISITQLVSRSKTVTQMVAYKATCTDLATNGGTIIS